MKNLILTTAAAAGIMTTGVLTAATLFAQNSELPGAAEPSRVEAGTYVLDPAHTLVEWSVSHFGFTDYFGIFGDIEGSMTLDPSDISETEFEIMVPIADVTVASEQLKDHLLRPGEDGADPDFFGPQPGMATFTSTNVRRTGDTTAIASGMLTMNERTGPVTMLVELEGAGTNPMNETATVGFHARAVIDRTQWGVNYGQGLIGNDVELKISAAFERQ